MQENLFDFCRFCLETLNRIVIGLTSDDREPGFTGNFNEVY